MEEQNHKQAAEKDELDRLLDAALATYAAVEPRAGLEGRILANLSSQQVAAPRRLWWRWTLAVGLAAIVIAAVTLALRSGRQPRPVIVRQAPVPSQDPREPQPSARSNTNKVSQVHVAHKPRQHPHQLSAVAVANPKLDQFPSPQPLTEQEKLLANYVAQFGDEAVMVARARAEDLREELEKEAQETEADTNHAIHAR